MGVTKLRVGVIYGGRSGEHEVSIASAASIFKHLDPARYEPVPIRIEKDGRWVLTGKPPTAISAAEVLKQAPSGALQSIEPTSAVRDRKSTRLNSSHSQISYAVFCLKKKNTTRQ